MKKNLVLFVLFILPIVAYLFFASGVNGFIKLPVLTPKVAEFNNWKTIDNKEIHLKSKITILGFPGANVDSRKGNFFNLNQKIFKKYREFKDFQIVMLVPFGSEPQVKVMTTKLAGLNDISNWHFVFASNEEIQKFYNNMELLEKINTEVGTTHVFIIDKERNVRGRKGQVDKDDDEYREGYNTSLVSEMHNELNDDVKIVLAEYRLALKKNNADRKKYGL
ncbi:hypothetical protein [Flavobacterium sp.]|uniref:hypothetical protein n=1 Tax=Flavobacterium sp. TaxID=239 RepID=UPI002B4B79EA|nr:hypothetical protein [Flavobacterium sp.]HLP62868.1 hypothetical protein [Flavobacterium sp.]